jgi:hypothetical protein
MVRRVDAAPRAKRAYNMKLMRPALPRRAGLASSMSWMRMPKPGTPVSQTSTRWPGFAGGNERKKRSVKSLLGATE